MNIAIIRSCDRDDERAVNCYNSMRDNNIADKYIFFHDGNKHPLIVSTGEEIFYHESCGNYGGLGFVKIMITELARLPKPKTHDYILFCDSDVTFYKNPMPLMSGYDHGGIFGEAKVCPNIPHVSGQLNIITGWLWNNYIAGGVKLIDDLYTYQVLHGVGAGTADDTLFSIFAHLQGAKQKSFRGLECWKHG